MQNVSWDIQKKIAEYLDLIAFYRFCKTSKKHYFLIWKNEHFWKIIGIRDFWFDDVEYIRFSWFERVKTAHTEINLLVKNYKGAFSYREVFIIVHRNYWDIGRAIYTLDCCFGGEEDLQN